MKYVVTKQDPYPEESAPGIKEIFLFPKHLEFDVIIPLLGAIKNENYGNWHRVRREAISTGSMINGVFTAMEKSSIGGHSELVTDTKPIASEMDADLFKKQISYDCKYIVVKTQYADEVEDVVEEIYVFPKAVHHDCFYEIINNQDEFRKLISAGFVDSNLQCYGKSETLNVESRKEDTDLLKKQMS